VGDLFTIGAGSPAVAAAGPGVSYVTDDIAGRSRGDKPDIGAEQPSSPDKPRYGLLGEADVGPMAP
jgi:hypothetical protein